MGKLKYKYVMDIHVEEDEKSLYNVPVLFGNVINLELIFSVHPEMKSITFRPLENEEGQERDQN